MKETSRAAILSAGSAILATLICLLMMRNGVSLTPDGWAYWEGSVSILHGRGYAYFGGQPIHSFPPLFPTFLAALQTVFGVSGSVLLLGLTLLAGVNAFLWTLLHSMVGNTPARIGILIGALHAAFFSGMYFTTLLAESLALPLLALSLISLLQITNPEKRSASASSYGLLGASITLLLLSKNSNIALIPAYFLAIALSGDARVRQIGIAMATTLVPILIWGGARIVLLQMDSHTASLGGRYSAHGYVEQIFSGFANLLGPGPLGMALLALGSLAIMLTGAKSTASRMRTLIGFTLCSSASLWLLFNLTWIHDALTGRFLWHLPLLLCGILLAALTLESRKSVRLCLWGTLAAIAAVQMLRTTHQIHQRLSTGTTATIQIHHSLNPDYMDGPPIPQPPYLIIAPPAFPWIDRQRTEPRENVAPGPAHSPG
jgi:hypothetical protein